MKEQSSDAGLSGLPLRMRGMVLRIVSSLLEEGYRQDKAFLIAIGQVETWIHAQHSRSPVVSYHIVPHPLGWVVRHLNSANPCLVFNTRDEATQYGQDLAQEHNANLVIHADTGAVHNTFAFQ